MANETMQKAPRRYEKMRDSGVEWIGMVPEEWEIFMVGQLTTQVKDKNVALQETNLLSLSYGKIKRKSINTTEGLLPASFDNYNIIEAGDVVLRLTDLQNDQTSLRVGLAREKGIITSAYLTIRPQRAVWPNFLYYALHSFDIRKGFYGMGTGVRQGLKFDEVRQIRVVIPSLRAQKSIASYLEKKCNTIDGIVAEVKASIEEYKAWKSSIIYEAVTKGLDPNAEMKDSGVEWIGKIPVHWKCCRQKHLIRLINGRAYKDSEFEENGKYQVLRVGNLFSNPKWYTSSLELEAEKYCDKGDLLYAWSMSYGPVIWNGEKVIYHYHIWKTQLSDKLVTKFAYYYLIALSNNIRAEAHATTMGFVTMSTMNNAYIAYPTVTEQVAISNCLDQRCAKIDDLIKEKEALISDLEAYKKSLIYEVVTGKRKVV